ncbi:ABC transporter ATP-binding protein [Rhizobium rhizogenes]|uniref:ABC transporter ATP-binding protein n=1 Tax=Rhizobium rhizogenes TaxID=359 RepID=UPI001572F57F|nr:ABC transporter ATP-binding protein [Rhizobium rhizogenes]NTI78561.1 ABC transporter ATP-binding protein [Rhizobium rhizogenes]
MPDTDELLTIVDLTVEYPSPGGTLKAVEGVSLAVGRGERVGIVGESGSGKSTTAFAAMGLLRTPGRVTAGQIVLDRQDVAALDERAMNALRGTRMAMVYQDPFTFLNPLYRVGAQVAETLLAHGKAAKADAIAQAVALLDRLGLPGAVTARKYPHQLSGGQRQRIVIAMALIGRPDLVIADEPTTALDVTVQAQILDVLADAIRELGTSLLIISHDLAVMQLMCDRVYVMYAGRVVEHGPAEALFAAPAHPYTQALMRASRRETDEDRHFYTIAGNPPDLRRVQKGCRFADRCPHRMAVCTEKEPPLRPSNGTHAACWLEAAA